MKIERAILLLAVCAIIWCAFEIGRLRKRLDQPGGAASPVVPAGPTMTNLEARLKKLEAATPSPGMFMSAIQLHFAKLFFAAEARNWELAQFERGEILENLEVVTLLLPEDHGVKLAGIVDAFKNTPLTALQDAITMKDRGLFRDAYRDCILTCNACHQATGRPFITITVPTNPPVSNQLWAPASAAEK